MESKAGFDFLDHTADVWVKAWGSTLNQAAEQCVYALMQTMTEAWPEKIEESISREIKISEKTRGSLLVGFLSEFLFLFDTEDFLVRRVQIHSFGENEEGWGITATAFGESFDSTKHIPDTEVKAITYSFLEIWEESDLWNIKIVYDI